MTLCLCCHWPFSSATIVQWPIGPHDNAHVTMCQISREPRDNYHACHVGSVGFSLKLPCHIFTFCHVTFFHSARWYTIVPLMLHTTACGSIALNKLSYHVLWYSKSYLNTRDRTAFPNVTIASTKLCSHSPIVICNFDTTKHDKVNVSNMLQSTNATCK